MENHALKEVNNDIVLTQIAIDSNKKGFMPNQQFSRPECSYFSGPRAETAIFQGPLGQLIYAIQFKFMPTGAVHQLQCNEQIKKGVSFYHL